MTLVTLTGRIIAVAGENLFNNIVPPPTRERICSRYASWNL